MSEDFDHWVGVSCLAFVLLLCGNLIYSSKNEHEYQMKRLEKRCEEGSGR